VRKGFDHDKPVKFYDTTLRDGEQAVGVVFNPEEKFNIACGLADLGVGRIEAGFPRVSEADSQAVKRIVEAGLDSEIWGFSRAVKGDLDALIELGIKQTLIEISTSEVKMKAYGFDREIVLQRATEAIKHAVDKDMRVLFFPVDSTRSDLGYLQEVYGRAIESGASEVAVVDTIGACAPEAVEKLLQIVPYRCTSMATMISVSVPRWPLRRCVVVPTGYRERSMASVSEQATLTYVRWRLPYRVYTTSLSNSTCRRHEKFLRLCKRQGVIESTAGVRWSARICLRGKAAPLRTSSTFPKQSNLTPPI
jgi:hypothetical protein